MVEDPNDPRAHVVLGEAYLTILFDSRERVWATEFKQLRELRQAQAATALHRAVRLSRTPPARAHRLLSLMYRRIGYLDLCLDHLTEARQADALSAPGTNPDPEAEKDYERLRDHVRDLRGQFDKESAGLRLADRATLAGRLNLHGQALETLLKSDISAFGAAGLKQQLELMIRTGRAGQVVEWTSPEQRDAVGTRSYHWLRAQAFAGLGDYTSADLELVEIGGGAAETDVKDRDSLPKTLEEASYCRKKRIAITTFMLATDGPLLDFVRRLTELNHGRIYETDPNNLGAYVFRDFVRNRRKRLS